MFPTCEEADWRKAAEAALKGVALETLVSQTTDGLALGPLYAGGSGPRAFRNGPWRAFTRLDHPAPDDFSAQAHEDLDNGAQGLTLVFEGAGAAYGYGLAGSLAKALDGVALSGGRFALEIGEPAQAEAFADLVAAPQDCEISFGLDPLGARARGAPPYPLGPIMAKLHARGFRGPFVAADARLVHDAGGTPAQELAFALAAGVAYLRELQDLGAEDPSALEFRLSADADVFATLAKFRALRLLWARVEQASGLAARPITLAASSAWRMMTRPAPYVNVMRAATAAIAAGLGGADTVTLLPFTQALGLPDAFARRLARNTQLIELQEARLGFVADPAAGAGGFEALTLGLCETAWALFQSYEAVGGLGAALDSGLVQSAVAAAAAVLRSQVASAASPLTGVSAHADLEAALWGASPAATTTGGLTALRLSEPFERLREAAKGAQVYLAAMTPSAAQGRLGFAQEAFATGGIGCVVGAGAPDTDALVAAFTASGAQTACLCGTDEAYAEHATPFAMALKRAGARVVYLIGERGAAGIDGYIYPGVDLVAALGEFLSRAGR